MHTHARGYTLYVYTCDACLSLAWCFGRVACHRGSVRCKSAPTTVRTEPRMDNDCWQLLLLRCVRRESSCPNRAVMQSAVAFQFAFTWINRRLGRMTAPRAHFASRSRIFTYRLWQSSARTWELRGAAPPCSWTPVEFNASILEGSIP